MSHLNRHRQKQSYKKLIWLIVLGVVMLIFTFQIGLDGLINAAIVVNNLFSSDKKDNLQTNQVFYGTLDIDEPASATNEAKLEISGQTTEYDTIEIFLNNVEAESTSPKTSGEFVKIIGTLKEGNNTIYIVAKTADGKQQKKSDTYNVTFIDEPPALEIEAPADNAKVSNLEIEIKGRTDPGVTVRLNNSPVVVDVAGNFRTSYRLKDGENKLEILALDIAQNETKKTLTVIREKDE